MQRERRTHAKDTLESKRSAVLTNPLEFEVADLVLVAKRLFVTYPDASAAALIVQGNYAYQRSTRGREDHGLGIPLNVGDALRRI